MSWDDKNTKELFEKLATLQRTLDQIQGALVTLAPKPVYDWESKIVVPVPQKKGRPKGSKNKRKHSGNRKSETSNQG